METTYANALPNSSCWIVWDKENTGNFADAELAWTNQDTVVRVFKHMWNGMLKASEREQKRVHPTQKPVALAEWCFENYGNPATVLDLFLGLWLNIDRLRTNSALLLTAWNSPPPTAMSSSNAGKNSLVTPPSVNHHLITLNALSRS